MRSLREAVFENFCRGISTRASSNVFVLYDALIVKPTDGTQVARKDRFAKES